ncbi:MAG: hypothetical protein JWP45_3111 [Mucilaginibacter sp.]|nr:hypothetical protein [Mucilaginibacter sp.]MDB5138973.1 hypothetical protein [Mucilaginibacter sp.]
MFKVFLTNWFHSYQRIVKNMPNEDLINIQNDLDYWKNQLFLKFLIYCFPISFIALLPGVYMSFNEGYIIIGVVDCLCFALLVIATFCSFLPLKYRKLLIITLFYILAIFLIANLGYIGPGIFYLFATTILIALIVPIRYAYWSIAANAIILSGFAAIIYLKPFNVILLKQYSAGEWIAFSSNLIFLSIVLVVLIHAIFDGLQSIILTKDQLQSKYKNIFESSPLPMWLFDTNSLSFLDVNDAAIAHYGYKKAEFMAMTIKDIQPSETVVDIESIVNLNRGQFKFHHDDVTHVKKNGEKINVKVQSSLLDFNGRKAKLVLVTDITSQIKTEREMQKSALKLKQSEANLRAIFESTLDGFVLLDHDSNIIAFNLKAQESIMFNNNQIAFEFGKSIFDYIQVTRRTYFKELLQRVHLGEVIEYERKFRINGKIHWINYTLTPVKDSDKITRACITGRDITAHRQYVQTIEKQNKIFREISWIQSHLVRAPLARVMGLTSLLCSEKDEDEKAEILKMLQYSSNELDNIIKKITDKTSDTI